MKSNLIKQLVPILAILVATGGYYLRQNNKAETVGQNTETPGIPKEITRDELVWAGKPVTVTKHGHCRMDCREIDAYEVQQILLKGQKNVAKSKPNDTPCPSTALEGVTRDGQRVRIVVSDCGSTAKLVTVIDLETDYKCDCY